MSTMRRPYLFGMILAIAMLGVTVGCHQGVLASGQSQNEGPDPADQNMAPVDGSVAQQPAYSQQQAPSQQQTYSQPPQGQPGAVNESQQQADQYARTGQTGAPIERRDPNAPQDSQAYPQGDASQNGQPYDDNYNEQDTTGQALEADQPPPQLPTYDQPEAPEPDYLWTPGYWAWAPVGYYWVPGVWCAAPYRGALWTPGYWYFYGNRYRFHRGFWGLYVGFYGGINYGFGYFGTGYRGGYWNGPHFYYNRAVNRINPTRITNVYNHTVIVNNVTMNRISYNGGRGGLQARPQPAELVAMRQPRTPPMTTQLQVQRQSAENRAQYFNTNRGRPAIVAAPRPIMADKGIQRPMPVMQARPVLPGQLRPGQQIRSGQPQVQPGQVQPGQVQPGQVQPGQVQPGQRQPGQVQPGQRQPGQVQPGQRQPGQVQPGQRQPGQVQPGQLQPGQQIRPVQPGQPQVQPGYRPMPGNPQVRPTPEPQVRPQPEVQRPNPQQQQVRPAPQQEFRPQPQPQPRPQQEIRPMPQPRPQQEMVRPAPQPQSRPAPQQFGQEPQPRPQFQQPQPSRPQQEMRPQPQFQQPPPARPQQEMRPQMQPRPQESRPAPSPRAR
jgi:hypothetical protein